MTLDTEQTRFVDELLHGSTHMILTGKAGTGKSTALCAGVQAAQAAGMDILVMAPTAMAASIHRDNGLESGTIHHALRWNPARCPLPRKLLEAASLQTDWESRPDQGRVLVVDEASMVGLWLFEILARDLGKPGRPFEGRRLVLVGDWAQLPPVVGNEETDMAKAMPELNAFGPADGCVLYHKLFRIQPPVAIELEETHRANSEWFAKLNALRDLTSPSTLGSIGMNLAPRGPDGEGVHLCYRRVVAHRRNAEKLAKLPGRPVVLNLRDGEQELKEGCEVIVTSNRAGGGYINGSRAIFSGQDEKGRVVLDDGNAIKILVDGNWGYVGGGSYQGDENSADYGRAKACRLLDFLAKDAENVEEEALNWLRNVLKPDHERLAAKFGDGRITFLPYCPIVPGYAITVHKAQGMTLPEAVIEEDVFWSIAPARLPYVALSRVPDESNIAAAMSSAFGMRVRHDPAYPPIISRIRNWRKV